MKNTNLIGSTGSKISRLTYSRRFTLEDEHMKNLVLTKKINSVFDIGVSNGVTTYELFEKLDLLINYNLKFYACDIFSKLYLQDYFFFKVYKKFDNEIAYFESFRIKFSRNLSFKRFVQILIAIFFEKLYKILPNIKQNEINFFDSSFSNLLNNNQIIWVDHDFFDSPIINNVFNVENEKFIARIFNVLNLGVIELSKIKFFLSNLILSLPIGSRIWIGRTDNYGITNSSIFIYNGKRLIIEKNFGTGSELVPYLVN
jgi:hypothetical protein